MAKIKKWIIVRKLHTTHYWTLNGWGPRNNAREFLDRSRFLLPHGGMWKLVVPSADPWDWSEGNLITIRGDRIQHYPN